MSNPGHMALPAVPLLYDPTSKPAGAPPVTPWPTLQEYKVQWSDCFHARVAFSLALLTAFFYRQSIDQELTLKCVANEGEVRWLQETNAWGNRLW